MVEEYEIPRSITKVLTPTTISAQQNNYNPSGINDADFLRLSGNTSFQLITGLIKRNANDMSAVDDGAEITLRNVSDNTLLLCDELSTPAQSSTAANRFKLTRDVPLFPYRSISLVYDGTLLRWIPKLDISFITPPAGLGVGYLNHGFNNASDGYVDVTAASGGAVSDANQANVIDRNGLLEWSTGTSATGSGSLAFGGFNSIMLGNNWYWRCEMIFRVLTLSSAGMNYTLRLGFIDSITAESTDGAFFRYNHSVNSAKYQAVTRSNNVETGSAGDTAITTEVNNYHKFTVVVYPAGNVADFYIDNVKVFSQTANIPTAASRGTSAGFMFIKTAGTSNAAFLVLDSFEVIGFAPKRL